eukprot:2470381-Rhodomonas_salina.2
MPERIPIAKDLRACTQCPVLTYRVWSYQDRCCLQHHLSGRYGATGTDIAVGMVLRVVLAASGGGISAVDLRCASLTCGAPR